MMNRPKGRISSAYFRHSVDEDDGQDENKMTDDNKMADDNKMTATRRMTLPVISVKGSSVSLEEPETTIKPDKMSLGYDLARRASVTNMAICCSIAPSLASLTPDLAGIRRSATENNLAEDCEKRRPSRWQSPFLRLRIPEDKQVDWPRDGDTCSTSEGLLSHHHFLPTLPFSAPSDGTGRKFSFGIRRHSHVVSLLFVQRPLTCYCELFLKKKK